MTLSFWIKSTKTGTFNAFAYQPDGSRFYNASYTVNVTDTWEHKTVTISGDSGGTINDDTGAGLIVGWTLIAGTNWTGSADTWSGNADYAASSYSMLDSTSNDIFITGVQLEVGSVATDFEHEDIGTTLAKCKRYLFRLEGTSTNVAIGQGYCQSSTEFRARIRLPVEMRATPTGSQSGAGATSVNVPAGRIAATGTSTSGASKYMGTLVITTAGSLTTGQGGTLEIDTTSDWVQWSAEL
jgi:hypothetical protein